jgi:HEAT repeat protein
MATLDEVRKEIDKDELDYPELALALGPGALPQLQALVAEDEPRIASKAAYLAGLISEGNSHEIVALAARSRHDVVRVAAAAAAAKLPTQHAVSVTSQLLKDSEPGVRIRAMKSAATIDEPALAAQMKTMGEQDKDPHVRTYATGAYPKMRQQ